MRHLDRKTSLDLIVGPGVVGRLFTGGAGGAGGAQGVYGAQAAQKA